MSVSDEILAKLTTILITLRDAVEQSRQDTNTGNDVALSDRAFLVKSVKLIRASAVLRGRGHCEPEDLRVLRFLTTFRVASEVCVSEF